MRLKILLAIVLVGMGHSASAASFVNGSFEAATNPASLSYISLPSGSSFIPGWITTNAEVTLDGPSLDISPPLTAAQGSDFLDLTGEHDAYPFGAVFQTVATTPGQPYEISFELGSDKYYDSYYTGTFTAPMVAVSLDGVVAFSATNNYPGSNNYWQTWSFNFTATNTNTTVMLTGMAAARLGYIGLDNVVLTHLPVIVMGTPTVPSGHAQLPFTVARGTASSFELLESSQVTGPWVTNSSAVLVTNTLNVSYTFLALTSGAQEFYFVQSP